LRRAALAGCLFFIRKRAIRRARFRAKRLRDAGLLIHVAACFWRLPQFGVPRSRGPAEAGTPNARRITVSLRGQRCRFGLDADALWNYPAGMNASSDFPAWFALLIPVLILLALWDGVWKVIGMWKSARNKQLAWFICIAIFNTVGILPIIYLTLCQKDCNQR
jgi:hypothetical protein